MPGAVGLRGQADTLFSNFGPGDAHDSIVWGVQGANSGRISQAFAFTVGDACYTLDTIELAATLLGGPNSLVVKVLSDNGGLPGAEIESFSFTDLVSLPGSSILLGTSVLNPQLLANTKYWLAAFPGDPDTFVGWNFNSIGDTSPHAESPDGGLNWSLRTYIGNERAGAFRITGTVCKETVVPEPSALLVLAGSLPGLGFLLRRRRV